MFPIVPPDAPRPDEYMMFNVEYTLPHNHDELPPTPGQGPSGVTTGVTPTFMTSNISSNSPKKDDDDVVLPELKLGDVLLDGAM